MTTRSINSADQTFSDETPLLPQDVKPRNWTFLSLVQLNSCLFCIQLGFAVEFSFLAPYFHSLGVSNALYPFVWIAGPLSGLITQPIAGSYSDNSTHPWGKRRPFILAGSILSSLGFLFLGFSTQLGHLMGDTEDNHSIAIALSILAIWIININLNVMMGPGRALLGDVVSKDQQQLANGIAGFMIAIASFVGNAIGAVRILDYFPFFASQFQALFLISMVFVIVFSIPTLLVDEKKYALYSTTKSPTPLSPVKVLKDIWISTINMPKLLRPIVITFFFSWAGISPFFIYISSFVAQNIFRGVSADVNHNGPTTNPHGKNYLAGLRFAAMALAAQALVAMFYSAFIEKIGKMLGVKVLYTLTQLLFSCITFLLLFVINKWVVFVLILLAGFQLATINAIPFALLAENFTKNLGMLMGILNFGSVVAQMFSNFLAGLVIHLFHDNIAAGIAAGGVWAIIGLFTIPRLPVQSLLPDVDIVDDLL